MDFAELGAKFHIASKRVTPVAEKKMETLSQVGVGLVKQAIQAYHAVDTGTMLNSTQAEKLSSTSYLIGPTVLYAPFVALGTSRMAARPFHTRAAKQLEAQAAAVMDLSPEELGL